MFVPMPFHATMSGQTDDRFSLPLPMVYEHVAVELPRWEYRVLPIDTREELGNEGWLLVGMLDQRTSGSGSVVWYHFLRQKI
jgi:hypothetical protein